MAITFETCQYVVHRCDGTISRTEEVRANEYGELYWDWGARYCYRCGEALPDYISEEAKRAAGDRMMWWVKS